MFDVIRVSRRDADLYDFFVNTYGPTGYFQIKWQDDPRAETEVLFHVMGDGRQRPRGRQAVLDHLAREYGHDRAEVDRRMREALERLFEEPFCVPGSSKPELACPPGDRRNIPPDVQDAIDRHSYREAAFRIGYHDAGAVRRGRTLRVPRAYCGWTQRQQELFLLSNTPTSRFPWAAHDLHQRLLPYCGPTRSTRLPPIYYPAAQVDDDIAEIDLDSGEVQPITSTTQPNTGFWWKVAAAFAAGTLAGYVFTKK